MTTPWTTNPNNPLCVLGLTPSNCQPSFLYVFLLIMSKFQCKARCSEQEIISEIFPKESVWGTLRHYMYLILRLVARMRLTLTCTQYSCKEWWETVSNSYKTKYRFRGLMLFDCKWQYALTRLQSSGRVQVQFSSERVKSVGIWLRPIGSTSLELIPTSFPGSPRLAGRAWEWG